MATGTISPKIPRNYDELFRNYGAFIANEVRKANTVAVNLEDALGDVQCKLMEADVIGRFNERVNNIVCPDTLTAEEACEQLGISWGQWEACQRGFHEGKCSNTGRDVGKWMPTPIQKEGAPEGSCVGYSSKKANFHGKDIERLKRENANYGWHKQGVINSTVCPATLTAEEACNQLGISLSQWIVRQWGFHKGHPHGKGSEAEREVFKWMPTPIQEKGTPEGSFEGHRSKSALFHGKDIERLKRESDDYKWRNQGPILMFKVEPTGFQWLNYLGLAVRNHFANFCRTRDRKYKERAGDCVLAKQMSHKERQAAKKEAHVPETPKLIAKRNGVCVYATPTHENTRFTACPRNKLGSSAPQFHTEEGTYNANWEDTIADNSADARIEAQIMVRRTLERLSAKGIEPKDRHDIVTLLASGYTMAEAIQKSELPKAKKHILLVNHERNDLVLSQRFVQQG